jgi:hypothetical protein
VAGWGAHTLRPVPGQSSEPLRFMGVDGAVTLSKELVQTSLTAIEPLSTTVKSLRELALLVRDRVS